MADFGVLSRRLLVFEIITVTDGPLHVRLAGADPDLADEHVGEGDGVVALDGYRERAARFLGRQFDGPFAVVVGNARRGITGAQCDRDLLAHVGPAPHGNRLLALENHVVAEDVRHTDIGGAGRRHAERGQADKEDSGDS